MTGRLFLIPTDLGETRTGESFGSRHQAALMALRHLVAENPKTARRFLKALGVPVQQRTIDVLDANTQAAEVEKLAALLRAGEDLGLLSEAGCPGIADPGAALVALAHRDGQTVIPLVGPCSIVLALMASGLNGQQFAFNGYLPQRSPEREQRIAEIETRSLRFDQTQIFIETPYRNAALFQALVATCRPETLMCVASELTTEREFVRTRSMAEWKKTPPELDKRPTVFLLSAKPLRSLSRRDAGSGRVQ
jgi:16S rRNA (cytidine1402-2'-O)-methyltransferase